MTTLFSIVALLAALYGVLIAVGHISNISRLKEIGSASNLAWCLLVATAATLAGAVLHNQQVNPHDLVLVSMVCGGAGALLAGAFRPRAGETVGLLVAASVPLVMMLSGWHLN